MTKSLYSVEEFSAAFGIGKTKIYALLKSGELSARKIGRRTVIPTAAAEAWAASLPGYRPTVGAAAEH
jgi:excisionase family DNA binding protein